VEMSKVEIHAGEITFLIQPTSVNPKSEVTEAASVYCPATGDEFAGSPLCSGRPKAGVIRSALSSTGTQGRHFCPDFT
jgi:hypothetical protein